MSGFSYTPEFGWFVCGAMMAFAFDAAGERDWSELTFYGSFSVLLLVVLIRDRIKRQER